MKRILMFSIIFLTVFSAVSCEKKKASSRRKFENQEKSLWKKEYENELTEAMLTGRKHDNNTRKPQASGFTDSDNVLEKLMETIMSSERYLKKVESIDFRLNRLDIEVHEKTNSILKQLIDIMKLLRTTSDTEKYDSAMETFKSDLIAIRAQLEKPGSAPHTYNADGHPFHSGSPLDARLTSLENNVKNIMSGVDSVVSIISEVKSRQFTRTYPKNDLVSTGGVSLDAAGLISEFRKTMHEQKMRKCECKTGRVDRSERYPTDCHEIQMQGFNVSGIYKIKPEDMEPFYVLCDLTTAGGAWTVFQNRFDGSQDFYKGWADYKHGFGNLAGEFWLGLEKLSYLTNQKLYELRVELETQQGHEGYSAYSVFTVGPEYEGFRISTLGTYYGTAGDSLSYHAGQKFSTLDVDNDEWKDGACSMEHGGAWWYKECDKSNLNGKYSLTNEDQRGQTMYWISFKSPDLPLSKTKMMIRPLPASKPINYEANRINMSHFTRYRPRGNDRRNVHLALGPFEFFRKFHQSKAEKIENQQPFKDRGSPPLPVPGAVPRILHQLHMSSEPNAPAHPDDGMYSKWTYCIGVVLLLIWIACWFYELG
ncbi:angiopoietin-related protein 4-like isoform X2 [Plodia interpunctella]|uniref:angiopoietin-related protein 4-like isoform X2 n=1 Tax=Plodia interpunctella TaxID=58824 RepID=UPI0023683A9B|nr:angiopoietin-related protein 4-like isoform X2 [Plodia interpunctella]